MKLLTHAPRAKKDVEYKLRVKHGLFIQLSRTERLCLEKGDTVASVAAMLQKHLPVSAKESLQLASYYFALAERLASKTRSEAPWSAAEIAVKPLRTLK